MLIQRQVVRCIVDVVKCALSGFEFKVGSPLVWIVGVNRYKELEWFLFLVKW